MIKVEFKFTPNPEFMSKLKNAIKPSLEMAGTEVHGDLIKSQTMPFDVGTLQNDFTYVDYSEADNGDIRIITQGPYARRLYFHPEYNFQRGKNPLAGGRWFDPYIHGEKKDKFARSFANILKKKLEGL